MKFKDFIRSIKPLDKRIEARKKEIAENIETAMSDDRYSLFEFSYTKDWLSKCEKLNDFDKYDFFYGIAAGWDPYCNFDRKTGEMIDQELSDESSIIAIHRTNLGPVKEKDGILYNEALESIMSEGLINNGHAMYGGVEETPSLALTTSPITSFGELGNLLGTYKSNNMTILLKFPRDLVNNDLAFQKENDIYIRRDGLVYINPEYILGVIIKKHGSYDEYYSREEILSVQEQYSRVV